MPSKIKKRGKNSYLLTVSDGYDSAGKQIVYTKTVTADNDTEAGNLYDQFFSECLQGKVLPSNVEKMTMKQFYDYWKEHYAESTHEELTKIYNDDLFARIEVVLGHLRIDKVQPRQILDFIKQISAPDAGKDDKPLEVSTIKKHYTLLKTLFTCALGWNLITSNPMKNIKAPKKAKNAIQKDKKKKILNKAEMSALLDKLSGEPVKNQLWVLLAFSKGLRREEIFGLQWGDIDFDNSKITINRAAVYVRKKGINIKDTKSDNSFRVLTMPPDLSAMLKEWQTELRNIVKKRNKRRKVVSIEDPAGSGKWIFPQFDGTVGHPHSFNTFLRRLKNNNSLPNVSPHMLRHMTGSYLINSGIDIAAVSAELGHSNKAFTMKTYIHELQSAQEQSAATMQGILENLKTDTKKKGQA